jgi:hypothetical protein
VFSFLVGAAVQTHALVAGPGCFFFDVICAKVVTDAGRAMLPVISIDASHILLAFIPADTDVIGFPRGGWEEGWYAHEVKRGGMPTKSSGVACPRSQEGWPMHSRRMACHCFSTVVSSRDSSLPTSPLDLLYSVYCSGYPRPPPG